MAANAPPATSAAGAGPEPSGSNVARAVTASDRPGLSKPWDTRLCADAEVDAKRPLAHVHRSASRSKHGASARDLRDGEAGRLGEPQGERGRGTRAPRADPSRRSRGVESGAFRAIAARFSAVGSASLARRLAALAAGRIGASGEAPRPSPDALGARRSGPEPTRGSQDRGGRGPRRPIDACSAENRDRGQVWGRDRKNGRYSAGAVAARRLRVWHRSGAEARERLGTWEARCHLSRAGGRKTTGPLLFVSTEPA